MRMRATLRIAGCLAGALVSFQVSAQPATTPTPVPTPPALQQLPVSPAPFDNSPPPQPPPPGSPGYKPPPPASGTHDGFSYAPSTDHEGFSVIYPTDGTEPVYVSTSFLEINLQAARNDAAILQNLKNYEKMNAGMADNFMDQMFPDASADATEVQKTALQGNDRDIIVEPDPLAGPYARLTVTDKDGNVLSQSSLNGKLVSQILNQPYLTAEQKIEALARPGFYLPEGARQNFSSLTPEQLEAMVLESPDVAQQEFLLAAKVIAAEKAKKLEGEAARKAEKDARASATVEALKNTQNSAPDQLSGDRKASSADAMTGNESTTASAGKLESQKDPNSWMSIDQSKTPLIVGGLVAILALGVFAFGIYRTRR